MKYDSKLEACQSWVREMNQFPYEMIMKVIQVDDYDTWREITPPARYDRVYVYDDIHEEGEIIEVICNDGEITYRVELDNGLIVETEVGRLEVQNDYSLHMWGWLWQFSDSCDDWWLENHLQEMTDCGFRIYEHDEFGYFFGIDGAGYDFYEAHWLPLYDIRGLKWHQED